jgi:L,D-transpeptidase YcbB
VAVRTLVPQPLEYRASARKPLRWCRFRLMTLCASVAISAGLSGSVLAQAFILPALPDTTESTARDLAAVMREKAAEKTARKEPAAKAEIVLDLPALPDVVANFEAPVVLALPALPQPDTVADLAASVPASGTKAPITASALQLDLPVLPEVQLSVAPLRLDLTEATLRAALEPSRQRYKLKPAEIDSFVAAYVARDFRAIWLEGENADLVVGPKAASLREVLARAEASGLDTSRLLAVLPEVRSGKVDAARHVATDLGFSFAAFLFTRDLRGGRLEPSRLSALTTPTLELPDAGAVLRAIAGAGPKQLGKALLAYEPQHAGYQALKKALAKLREELAAPVLTGSVAGNEGAPQPTRGLPQNWLDGPVLAFRKPDARVPLLRQRLGLPPSNTEVYDADLRKAVKAFQSANDLKQNGIFTPKTRAALENPASPVNSSTRKPDNNARLTTLLANMERWRWLPVDLGKVHIFVNVADFQLRMVEDGKAIHQTRVIVGKPQTQTPIFSDEMEHVIVNPSWGVPSSIIKKEFLPKMAADPGYAAKRGYTVVRHGNQISIRQPPGARNALGYIKFIFPNQHSVYLHDTPNRSLFQNDMRAFSHGCVRVYQPFVLAEKLLHASLGYSEAQLKGLIGHGERMIKLKDKIPVHLTYFTMFVDENGEIQQRRDLYGHDARLRNALHL